MSNHTVNKISLVLPASDYNQAREHQASAKHWANHTLPMLLNDYLEAINKSDELIYLDKIEISLTEFPWEITDAVWKQKIQTGIKIQATSLEVFQLIFKHWLFYLQNGCFENSSIFKTIRESENYVFSNFKNISGRLFNEVRQGTISSNFLNRLLFQHSTELVVLFIEKLLNLNYDDATKITSIITSEIKKNEESVRQIIAHLMDLINQQRNNEKEKIIEQLINAGNLTQIEEPITRSNSSKNLIKQNKKESVENIYIACSNAGLVLLFPYIKTFFEATSLIVENEFAKEPAQQTAIQALLFLATGKDKGEEEEYIIPKLLCGVEPDEYISFENELDSSIKTEAEELLAAIIEHWKVLQNTSINGLREAFLQRDGKFVKRGGQYFLQVAESGVDILLNNIPWGFRNYTLPWMPFTIITEWY